MSIRPPSGSASGGAPTAHAASHASGGTDPVTLTESQITGLTADLAAKAPLASPALTGTPTAPTPSASDNSTKIATTAYADTAAGLLIPKSIGTTKGDQIGFTGSGAPVRHAIGADGTVQTADSTQADGWKWAAPAAGALKESQVQADIAFRAVINGGSAGQTNQTIVIPSTVQTGDGMLLFVSTFTAWSVTTPTGWTLVRTDDTTVSASLLRQYVFKKIATASDPGATVTIPFSGSARSALTLIAYSGTNTTEFVDAVTASVSSANTTTITAPPVTTTNPNALIVECFGGAANTAVTETVTNPATSRSVIAVASNFVGHAVSDQAQAAAGASAGTTATVANTGSAIGYSIALVPATAAADIAALRTRTASVNTVAASSTAQTIPDVTSATVNHITLTGNCTFTFPTAAAGKCIKIALKQDGTGSRTATWPAAVKWSGGTAPTLTTTAAKTDAFEFTCFDGTNWVGHTLGLNY